MTEQEALDQAAKVAGYTSYALAKGSSYFPSASIRAHAASLQRIAELEAMQPSEEEKEDFSRLADWMASWGGDRLHEKEGEHYATLIRKYVLREQPVDDIRKLFVEAFEDSNIGEIGGYWKIEQKFREALAARGLEIVKKGGE